MGRNKERRIIIQKEYLLPEPEFLQIGERKYFIVNIGEYLIKELMDAIQNRDYWVIDRILRNDRYKYDDVLSKDEKRFFNEMAGYIEENVEFPSWWEDRDPDNKEHNPRGYYRRE